MNGPTKADLENWFTCHEPFGDQSTRYIGIRAAAQVLAERILECTPPGADQSAAIRKVREAMMTANAAIACGERREAIMEQVHHEQQSQPETPASPNETPASPQPEPDKEPEQPESPEPEKPAAE